MSVRSLTPVNLPALATNPTSPTPIAGDQYFNTTLNAIKIYNGTSWSSTIPEIQVLDNLQYSFDGVENRFLASYQGTKLAISNPLRLLITVNGIVQTVNYSSVVWDSPLPWDGFRVDDDGYIAFSESVPAGSQFNGRIMAGTDTPTVTTTYPFAATDLLLGAF
jgi:hypothetical protein